MAAGAGWPRSQAIVLCLLCFFLGRFTVPDRTQTASSVQQVQPPRKVLEAVQPSQQPLFKSGYVGPTELSRLVEHSGLLQVKPPITPGRSGNPSYTVAPFQVLSWQPRLFLFPALLDPARCEHIIKLAQDKLAPSEVAPTLSDQKQLSEEEQKAQQQRTSAGAFLSAGDDPDGVLAWLEERIAAITQLPVENGEAFNVLRYNNNQYYESHLDAFDPKDYGPQASQRIATVLTVLRAPEEGGETVFKKEGAGGADREVSEWRQCLPSDFKYKPRQGDALVFWAMTPDGKVDEQALHGACPVKKGEKWVITKWIRNKPDS